jgi:hypothetical protein
MGYGIVASTAPNNQNLVVPSLHIFIIKTNYQLAN